MARKTASPHDQATGLTERIAGLKHRRAEIELAPLHQVEAEEQLTQDHNRKAGDGREHLRRHSRSFAWPASTTGLLPDLRTIERDGAPHLHSAGLQSVLAALLGDHLLEMKRVELREFYSEHTGLTVSAADRAKMLTEIDAEIHTLEVDRERIVSANGLPRCADASPAAILGVEPGAPLPWNFRDMKANNLQIEAENARGALVGIREEIGQLQILISRLEGDASAYREDCIPERLAADLEVARQDLADLQQQLTQRQETARTLNTIAARVSRYIADHRAPRPANTDALRKPVNKSAANGAA